MNWLDYLRGFEEGRYDRTSSGQSPGLLGALLKLALALIFLSITIGWLVSISIIKLLGWLIKVIADRIKKLKKKLPRTMR